MEQKDRKAAIKQAKIGSSLLALIICFCSIFTFGQKPMVALTASKKSVGIDEPLTFTVTSNMNGSMKIEFPNELQPDYGVSNGMNSEMDENGRLISQYFMQQSGSFSKKGTFSFFAYVNYRGKKYKSNKLTINVGESSNEDLNVRSNDAVFGVISTPKTSIYEGEPILLAAKIFGRVPMESVQGYSPFTADKSIERHDFPIKDITIYDTKINGKAAKYFETAQQLFIPITTGKTKVKPFEMAVEVTNGFFTRTVRIKSSALVLNVKPLPANAPNDFIGAVGTYELIQQGIQATDLKVGEVFSLVLVVKGIGNLHNIDAPNLRLPKSLKVYGDPEREEDYQMTEDGANGTIKFTYNIQILSGGNIHVQAPSISYFDFVKEKYITVAGESFSLNIKGNSSTATTIQNLGKGQQKPNTKIEKIGKQDETSNSWMLFAGGGGFLTLALLLLIFRKKKVKETIIENNTNLEHNTQESIELAASPLNILAINQDQNYWLTCQEQINDPENFTISLPKAILEEIKKQYQLQGENREYLLSELNTQNQDLSLYLTQVIQQCDFYRYGFGQGEIDCEIVLLEVKKRLNVN